MPVLLWEATFDDCSGAVGVVRSSDVLIVAGNHLESGTACLIGLSKEGDLLWKNEVAPPDSFTSITITSLALSPVDAVETEAAASRGDGRTLDALGGANEHHP